MERTNDTEVLQENSSSNENQKIIEKSSPELTTESKKAIVSEETSEAKVAEPGPEAEKLFNELWQNLNEEVEQQAAAPQIMDTSKK